MYCTSTIPSGKIWFKSRNLALINSLKFVVKRIYLQYWEESGKFWGIRPYGCSLHISIDDHKKYIKHIYSFREKNTPNEYSKTIGEIIEIMIDIKLYFLIKKSFLNSLRLQEYEMNNLFKLEEIIIL